MGQCCTSGGGMEPSVRKIHEDIARNMELTGKQDRAVKKVLLLGTGGAGKSTVLKNLRRAHGEELADERTRGETAAITRANMVHHMYVLLGKSQQLHDQDPQGNRGCLVRVEDPDVAKWIQLVVEFADETFGEESSLRDEELTALGDALHALWRLPAVQETFAKRGGRFNFADNVNDFLDRAREVMNPEYWPTDEDIIKSRVRTTGAVEYQYTRSNVTFNITDVGGQRSERKKWIHHFENVSAVLFVAALNHYNSVLFEDESKNSMHEAVELFSNIANSKWFRNSELILFLNKEDLFVAELRSGATLSQCYSADKGWKGEEWSGPNYEPQANPELDQVHFDECADAAIEFIGSQFARLNQIETRVVFTHVTTASDQKCIETVFWDVQNIVVRSNLRRGGLIQ